MSEAIIQILRTSFPPGIHPVSNYLLHRGANHWRLVDELESLGFGQRSWETIDSTTCYGATDVLWHLNTLGVANVLPLFVSEASNMRQGYSLSSDLRKSTSVLLKQNVLQPNQTIGLIECGNLLAELARDRGLLRECRDYCVMSMRAQEYLK
jgi:hypothetical protein